MPRASVIKNNKPSKAEHRLTRRRLLLGLLGAGAAGAGGIYYMRFLEPYRLGESHVPVPFSGHSFNPPLRILHLSDLHASSVVPLNFIEEAVGIGLSHKPDLICLTGDFITDTISEGESYPEVLRKLSDAAPTFACVGNHDGGTWSGERGGYKNLSAVFRLLEQAGIICLFNQSHNLVVRDLRLYMAGLGDLWSGDLNTSKAFAEVKAVEKAAADSPPGHGTSRVPEADLCILLSHNPDSKESATHCPWDIMLCGHTHGGQLYLPLLGTPFAPVRDHRYVSGLNRWNQRLIYTTKGVGNIYGLRFNCPPEVSILDIS